MYHVPYSVCCRSCGTAAIVHSNAPSVSVLLLIRAPFIERLVNLFFQAVVGGQGGVELLSASCVGVGLWPSWVLCVDQPAVNPVMFQATWALRLGLGAILVVLLRLRRAKLCSH